MITLSIKMEVTEFPQTLLQVCGQTVQGNRMIFSILHTGIVMFWFILGILRPIISTEGFEGWAAAIEVLGPSLQWIVKMIIYKLNKKSFRKLRKNLDEFWPLNSFDKETEYKLKSKTKFVTTFFKMYMSSAILTFCLMILKALSTFRSTRELPVFIYQIVDFTKSPYYEIACVLYVCHCAIVIGFVVGLDGIFLTFMAAAAFQLTLLKQGLRGINVDTGADELMSYESLKKYIKHHCLILEFVKEIKDIYSFYLIIQFLLSTLLICTPIYLFYTADVSDVMTILRHTLYSMACATQIFIYCITGSQIQTQLETVADAMYESDWWKSNHRPIRQAARLVILRANTLPVFKAGGMVALDLPSFVNVLRMSFSFFTLMQSTEATTAQEE